MPKTYSPNEEREFRCEHCKGLIHIPTNLPTTTGPCPYCSISITSPGADVSEKWAQPKNFTPTNP